MATPATIEAAPEPKWSLSLVNIARVIAYLVAAACTGLFLLWVLFGGLSQSEGWQLLWLTPLAGVLLSLRTPFWGGLVTLVGTAIAFGYVPGWSGNQILFLAAPPLSGALLTLAAMATDKVHKTRAEVVGAAIALAAGAYYWSDGARFIVHAGIAWVYGPLAPFILGQTIPAFAAIVAIFSSVLGGVLMVGGAVWMVVEAVGRGEVALTMSHALPAFVAGCVLLFASWRKRHARRHITAHGSQAV